MSRLVIALSLGVLLLGACGGNGGNGGSDGSIEVTVEGGEVSGDTQVSVTTGTEVELSVTSDTADTIHVHGYDLTQEVAAGDTATIGFTADIPGVFEIELEEAHLLLTELTVE